MFISVRGTSGSGKTYAANLVLRGEGIYYPPEPVFFEERGSRPAWYVRKPLDPTRRGIAILGSYASATGGCDTLSGNDLPFIMARHLHPEYDVFAEGLLHSAEQHRTAKLHADGYPVHLFYFNISLEECLAGVNSRRAARGNLEPVNPDTTAARHRTLRLHPGRFRALGLSVTEGNRADAHAWLRGLGVVK